MSDGQDLGDTTAPHMAVHMSGDNDLYGSDSEEVTIKKMDIQKDMITRSDLEAIIDDWEERFNKLTEGMRTIERGTHEVHAHMDMVMKDNSAYITILLIWQYRQSGGVPASWSILPRRSTFHILWG